MGFKARVSASLKCYFACVQWNPQIHLWCNTCWPLDDQRSSGAIFGRRTFTHIYAGIEHREEVILIYIGYCISQTCRLLFVKKCASTVYGGHFFNEQRLTNHYGNKAFCVITCQHSISFFSFSKKPTKEKKKKNEKGKTTETIVCRQREFNLH